MNLLWHENAWNEYCQWQLCDRKTLKRVNDLIRDISRNPFSGIGKPEPLKGSLAGFWSRRIDKQNRVVYKQLDENTIVITQCKNHY